MAQSTNNFVSHKFCTACGASFSWSGNFSMLEFCFSGKEEKVENDILLQEMWRTHNPSWCLLSLFFQVEETTVKKETIVKELAVNILELNNYRSRTEELDNKLKSFDQMKRDAGKSSPEIYSINEKSEVNNIYIC